MIILPWFSGSLRCTKCSVQWCAVVLFTIFAYLWLRVQESLQILNNCFQFILTEGTFLKKTRWFYISVFS